MDYKSIYIEDHDVYTVAITLKVTVGDFLCCGCIWAHEGM